MAADTDGAAGPGTSSLSGRTIVLAAGGTGGHLFPAQALAEALREAGAQIVLVTDDRGKTYTDGFPKARIVTVDAATFAGRGLLGKLRAGASILNGIAGAYGELGRIRPAAVVGFGGYPSLPAMGAAILRGVPSIIHEQNALLGRVNRLIASRVTAVASAFEDLKGGGPGLAARVTVTGNPVRAAIAAQRAAPYAAPEGGAPVHILVTGGSQGARVLGAVVPEALAALPPDIRARLRVAQQCRTEDQARVAQLYRDAGIEAELAPFLAEMDARLARTHLFVGRAGASTVTELGVVGRPGILVPLPGAMDDHQTVNADVLAARGAAWKMPEPEFTPAALSALVYRLISEPETLARAAAAAHESGRPDATRRLVALVAGLVRPGASVSTRPSVTRTAE